MKKTVFLCVIFALLAAVLSAAADSVWMPSDDYFMGTWDPASDNTCTSVERKIFIAAGENGYVNAVRTPVDRTPISTYPNGTEFIIDFFCGIGNDLWGTVRSVRMAGEQTFTEDYTGKSGYISKSDLAQAYDNDAFTVLHANSVYGFAEEFNICEPHFPFVIWTYPYSGIQLDVVTDDMLNWFCHEYNPEYFPIHFDKVYYAEDGSHWLSVKLTKPYTYGWLHYEYPMDGAIIQSFQ